MTTAAVQALHGQTIIAGDLNARTASLPDHADYSHVFSTVQGLSYSSTATLTDRANEDGHTDKFGRVLVEFYIQADIAILNGRTSGDPTGKVTCKTPKGSSTVDYFLASHDILHRPLHLTVHGPVPGSDHCPLQLNLDIGRFAAAVPHAPKGPAPMKFINDSTMAGHFRDSLRATLHGCDQSELSAPKLARHYRTAFLQLHSLHTSCSP